MPDPAATTPIIALGAYGAVAVLGALACAIVGGALTAVWLITRVLNQIPHDDAKRTTYECGEEPVGSAWFRFNSRFYLIALLFLIFDVELALLFPVLPRLLDQAAAGNVWLVLGEIGLFVGVLAVGLIYAARRGDFRWDKLEGRRRG